MKKILIIVLLSLTNFITYSQKKSILDIETEYLQRLDYYSRENKIGFLGDYIFTPYHRGVDKIRTSRQVFEQERNSMFKLILIGFDTALHRINWEFIRSKKKVISTSNYPSVLDETDSVRTVYNGLRPSDLKNPLHRKLFEEEIAQKRKDIEYRSQQSDLKYAYDKFYDEYIDKIVKEYYQNTEADRQSLYNNVEKYLTDEKERNKTLLKINNILSNFNK